MHALQKIKWLLRLAVDRLKALQGIAQAFSPAVYLPLPGKKVLFITHPNGIHHVLRKNSANYSRSSDFLFLRELIGDGLLTSSNEQWRIYRRISQSSFYRQNITSALPKIHRHGLDMLRAIEKQAQSVELAPVLTEMTLNVIGDVMFDRPLGADAMQVSEHVGVALRFIYHRALLPIDIYRYVTTPGYRRFKKTVHHLNAIMDRLLTERPGNPSPSQNLLDRLVEHRDAETGLALTHEQIRAQMMTVFLAGHETTASALAFAIGLLDQNPEVLAKVREEARTLLPDALVRAPTVEEISELSYTHSVVMETIRLFPPAWAIGREAVEADTVAGIPIEERTTVLMSPYVTQRDPRFWSDPDRFDPTREHETNPAYFPFGLGPRRCLGEQLAFMEMSLILAMFVSRFDFECVHAEAAFELSPWVTLRPKKPIRIKARLRQG